MARILIADDDGDFRRGLAETLADAGHRPIEAEDGHEALRALERERLDAAIVDLRMPGLDGLQLLARRRDRHLAPHLPVIVLTGFAETATTIEAMRLGAFDHLTKPVRREALLDTLAAALAAAEPAAEPNANRESGEESEATTARADAFVGGSEAMHAVQKRIGRAARSDAPVLITGETGTGKEVVARLLHRHSARAAGPCVAVNCAAIPAELLESELFGHVKGAFSGAISDRPGRFAQAAGGLLFLDEIGDMPLAMQAKLLRVLQDREYLPVGGSRPQRADVRVVAATHRDLERAVLDGVFRADLRFRLDVLRVELPPLRDRLADIVVLAEHFLKLAAPATRLSREAAQRLMAHAWPGNVRELRNVMERAAVGARGSVLQAADLEIGRDDNAAARPGDALEADEPAALGEAGALSLPAAIEQLERRMIVAALARSGGNRAEAARLLGIRRQLLYAKLATLGIGGGDDEGRGEPG